MLIILLYNRTILQSYDNTTTNINKGGKKKQKTKEDGTKDVNSTLYQNYHFDVDVVTQKKGIPKKKKT